MAFNTELSNIDEDRLSSLHNDILIGILSHLPIDLAIATETLSHRWRGLWTNLTSIQLSTRKFTSLSELPTIFDDIMMRITSPVIHSFILELDSVFKDPVEQIHVYDCVRGLYNRNVRELKVVWPYYCNKVLTLPRCFFQMESLVSIELFIPVYLFFPKQPGPFNLPNLKSLSLSFWLPEDDWLEELLRACPSLEKLYLKCFSLTEGYVFRRYQRDKKKYLECSHKRLKRLYINLDFCQGVVIRAPKLEYLSVRVPKLGTFEIIEKPVALLEAKIIIIGHHEYYLSKEETLSVSKFYEAISNVSILSMDIFRIEMVSTLFPNVTRLRLNMKTSNNNTIVLSILDLCPVLDDLTLHFWDTSEDDRWTIRVPEVGDGSTSRRQLKRLAIETENHKYYPKLKTWFLLELLECLLRDATGLEQFVFRIVDDDTNCDGRKNIKVRKGYFRDDEKKLCKLLYDNLVILMKNEFAFDFLGIFFKMSRKANHVSNNSWIEYR